MIMWTNFLKLSTVAFMLVVVSSGLPTQDKAIDSNDLNENNGTPASATWYDWKNWDEWEVPQSIRDAFTYYKSGYDKDGSLVYVMQIGRANFRWIADEPKDVQDKFWKYFEQCMRRMETDGTRNNNGGVVVIVDWDGFSLNNYSSSKALQITLSMFGSLSRLKNSIKYGFQINVNFPAKSFISLARPYLGDLLDKLEDYGTLSQIWKPRLLKKIDADELPPMYGGSQEWKPLSFRVSRR